MKLDLKRRLHREDETLWVKKRNAAGEPEEYMTLGDLLRDVYSSTVQTDTREEKSKKGRLLQKLNKTMRKNVLFELTTDDAKLTLDTGGAMLSTLAYIQLEDIIEGRKTIGEEEIEEETGAVTKPQPAPPISSPEPITTTEG